MYFIVFYKWTPLVFSILGAHDVVRAPEQHRGADVQHAGARREQPSLVVVGRRDQGEGLERDGQRGAAGRLGDA